MINRTNFAYRARFMALLLTMALIMTSCGKKEKVPKLLEPLSTNEIYTPVEYGDIGKTVIKMGAVVPTDHCYFYNTSANITSLNVAIGQRVKKDDVLAIADAAVAENEAGESGDSINFQQKTHSINEKIYKENISKFDYQIKACKEAGDTAGAKDLELQKRTSEENNRYDTMLYKHQLNKAQNTKKQQDDLITNNKLVSETDGYVTYVKNISVSNSAAASENVVIVSDYNDPYIQISAETVDKFDYSVYKTMYTVIDGEKYDLEIYGYSAGEMAVCESSKAYPNVRFRLKNGNKSLLETGVTLPLYFSQQGVSNVLIVSNTSIYSDGNSSFVYVKTEKSEKEKVKIETGESDANYTEVKAGLKEGDLVYSSLQSVVPSSYTKYQVNLSDFSVTKKSKSYTVEDTQGKCYTSPCDGEIEDLSVSYPEYVEKGTLLFTVDTGSGSAELKEAQMAIDSAASDYANQIKDYNAQISDLQKQQKDYATGVLPEKTASNTDADGTNYLYMEQQLGCDINIVKYNKELAKLNYEQQAAALQKAYDTLKEGNDGSGKKKVYAENSGYVENQLINSGTTVAKGDAILTVGDEESKQAAITTDDGLGLDINQKIILVSNADEKDTIEGRCMAVTGDSGKVYLTTKGDKCYLTHCGAPVGGYDETSDAIKSYVTSEDERFIQEPEGYYVQYPTIDIKNVVVVPANLIYTESGKTLSGVATTYYYVWKILGDTLVKKYVSVDDSLKDKSQICILSGLSQGDYIAKEIAPDGEVPDGEADDSEDDEDISGDSTDLEEEQNTDVEDMDSYEIEPAGFRIFMR